MERAQPQTAINTRSGRILDFANPVVDAIDLDDIAAGLAMVPRFGAQARRFYSVAQHAVSVSLIVERCDRADLALAALHHDSHEAYACDIPRPLKQLLEPQYSEVTQRVDAVIAEALGFAPPRKGSEAAALIKAADDAAFVVEADGLLPGAPLPPAVGEEFLDAGSAVIDAGDCWNFETALSSFEQRHRGLAAGTNAAAGPSHP